MGGAHMGYTSQRLGYIETIMILVFWRGYVPCNSTTCKQPQGEWTEYASSLTVFADPKLIQEHAAQYAAGDPAMMDDLKGLETICGRYQCVGSTQHGVPAYRQQTLDVGGGAFLVHFDGKDSLSSYVYQL